MKVTLEVHPEEHTDELQDLAVYLHETLLEMYHILDEYMEMPAPYRSAETIVAAFHHFLEEVLSE